ncbi:MAG: SUMF1/EgtB/PvdO family nonheme iron enzyme [Bacteroidia bacterium]|nr:SUMF1/EgtB/PvdO family nonheme iron enzyme [Bacteroidia bacterium]
MKRFLWGFIFVAISAVNLLKGQDVPAVHNPTYFYQSQNTDNNKSVLNPDAKIKQFLVKKGYVFIDSSSLEPEPLNGYDTIYFLTKYIHTGSFFLDQSETSNAEYKEFEKSSNVPAYLPDTLVWHTNPMDDIPPFALYYYQHKAYDNFPVVGVSYWQANAYCEWKTKQLNSEMEKAGIKDHYVKVELPMESEWVAAYHQLIPKWLMAQTTNCYSGPFAKTSRAFVLGCNGYRANFGSITTYRIENLKMPMPGSTTLTTLPANVESFPSVFGVYHLLGNVAEWTSSNGNGTLFNSEQYYYSMSNQILPQHHKPVDSNVLKRRLHTIEQLNTHYAIKGGSYSDDIYYLQPASMRYAHMHKSFKDVGFRCVVRVYKK